MPRPVGIPNRNRSTPELREKLFWSFVKIGGLDECWNWLRPLDIATGYGRYEGRGAHRKAFEYSRGKIPEALLVCHHCDNRACCNPVHLFAGTIADNNRDMWKKGRGKNNPKSFLKPDQVRLIRRIWIPYRYSARQIAKDFGFNYKSVENVVSNGKFKSVN